MITRKHIGLMVSGLEEPLMFFLTHSWEAASGEPLSPSSSFISAHAIRGHQEERKALGYSKLEAIRFLTKIIGNKTISIIQ